MKSQHDLVNLSLIELTQLLQAGKVSPVDLVEAHIARIEAVNPKINAIVTNCYNRARAEAKTAELELRAGRSLSLLHGIPFTAKDCHDTQGIRSTCGLTSRANHIPEKDAYAVARLRAAGAILLGKSNTPENCWSQETVNLVFGRTNNPYDLKRSVAGSSGGAAAAVAAGCTPFDVGSDIAGSIRLPAAFTGTVGLRPTSATLPEDGIWPPTTGRLVDLEALGPITRRVEDAALVFDILRNIEPQPLNVEELHGAKFAYWFGDGISRSSKTIQNAIRTAVQVLTQAGMVETRGNVSARRLSVLGWSAYLKPDDLRAVSRGFGNGAAWTPQGELVRHLIGKPRIHRTSLLYWLGTQFSSTMGRLFINADRWRQQLRAQLHRLIDENGIVLCPVHPTVAPRHGWNSYQLAPMLTINYQVWVNLAGLPGLTVPVGFTTDTKLPIAVLLVGNPGSERQLLNAGLAIQNTLMPHWLAPHSLAH